jgi:hypothetical protein
MTLAHIVGLPVEESLLQLVPAGAALATVIAIGVRTRISRLRSHLRRRPG